MFEKRIILIITDDIDSSKDFSAHIKTEPDNIKISSTLEESIEIFESLQPSILIFNNKLVKNSEKIYLDIYNTSSMFSQIKHRSIVLCDHAEVTPAFEQCIKNIFFDYVMINPRSDMIRINLSIRNAIKSMSNAADLDNSKKIVSSGKSVKKYTQELEETLKDSENLSNYNKESFSILSSDLKTEIMDFSENITKPQKMSNKVENQQDIHQKVDAFTADVIDKKVDNTEDRIKKVLEKYNSKVSSAHEKLSSSASAIEKASESITKKVLIIEDNEIYGEVVCSMLEKTNEYETVLVSSVQQGMVSFVCDRPDIVLLDYELEDTEADVFLEKISALPSQKEIPVIMLTSNDSSDIYTSTLMLGAKAFIKKPASKEIIIAAIKKLI